MKRLGFLIAIVATPAAHAADPLLTLNRGDHICIIGNGLAERMQHDGWLETLIHARHPNHQLVIRNLGFTGDEITTRLRSEAFGTPDEWLIRCKADVIFAFFGYNESWAGEAGLPKFKKDLDDWIKHTLAQKYNGRSAPRLVMFAPIGMEELTGEAIPHVKSVNARLKKYSDEMSDQCRANKVPLVDVSFVIRKKNDFKIRDYFYTTDGIHLGDDPEFYLQMHDLLFAVDPSENYHWTRDSVDAKLRSAVLKKNHFWFQRYRTVDGYSIYGGRADLKFTNGQTNREVMQREMEILDLMTANRDKVVWAAAQGKTVPPDDSNLPPFIPVITNKPGAGPNGAHVFFGGEEAIAKMKIGANLKVNLFASEERFPELANPVQMSWDPKGRLWVAVWPTYPHWKPTEEMNDKILIFEDTDGDGVADKMTVFADHLHCPTGFEFYNGGVIVAQAPDLMFLKGGENPDKAELRERILGGLDSADTHHTANSFTLDPGGALYFQEGTFHHMQVETPWGPPVRNANAGVYRYEPRTHKFDVYIPFSFANPHGHVFDRWGQDIVIDGTGSNPYHAALFSGHLDFPHKHKTPPQVYQQRTRPCPGVEICSSRHFPDDWQSNLLVANVIGMQGILRYRIDDEGASFKGVEQEPVLSSTDPNFRPSDMKIGPDGALYFLDWHNPIIGHMQHNLRDPSRDRTHGRIYRVTYEGRQLLKSPTIAGQPIEALLDCLKAPEDRVRYRTRIELSSRHTGEIVPAVERWLERLDKSDPEYEHQRLEALWVLQSHNTVNEPLLKQVLASTSFRARAAAVRVLCYQRDRIAGAISLLRLAAGDEHPRVRLEAMRAASFIRDPAALEIITVAQSKPTDIYLNYTIGETLRALESAWNSALASGRRPELEKLATSAKQATLRQAAWLALLNADQSIDGVWKLASASPSRLVDVLALMPRINELKLKVALFAKADSLVDHESADVRRAAMMAMAGVSGQEAKAFARIASRLHNTSDRSAALASLRLIPSSAWPVDQARALLDTLLGIIREMSEAERNQDIGLNTRELAESLAMIIPPGDGSQYRQQLRSLGVRVIRIGTLPERMSYDRDIVAVQAGRALEIIFENNDAMPHNLVIGRPGSLEPLGIAAEATATDADAPKRHYVPKSDKILLASQLVQPHQSQRLKFGVPQQPGVYPIVCTYPGHWRVMNAALYVVVDLEAYLANTDAYLSANPLSIADPLLKDRRPRTEWKFADLEADVATMKQGRHFANGKQLFHSASCSACHRLDSVGNNYGPDLTQMDAKWSAVDVLKEIVEPSARINEKFHSYIVTTASGKVFTGLIIEDTPERIKLIENPLSKAEPMILRKNEIESRDKSPTSLMPKGLIDKLSKDDALDLIAYVFAKGEPSHPLFRGHKH